MLLSIPTWRDPLHGLFHDIYKLIEPANHQRILGYQTACGLRLTVDDVNKKTLVPYEPTCLACIVNGVLPGKE